MMEGEGERFPGIKFYLSLRCWEGDWVVGCRDTRTHTHTHTYIHAGRGRERGGAMACSRTDPFFDSVAGFSMD